MKRIPTQKNGFWKRVFINIPFILLVALMIACFGGGLLLCFYSIVSLAAFNSAMIYLIVAGAGAILIGIGLCLITAYQKYFAFYNKKMGWKYVDDNKKPEKTVTYANKPVAEKIKKYLTVTNVGIGILALGSVFAIISAALGSIDRANWVNAIGGFREERGYYTDVKPEQSPTFLLTDANHNAKTINITVNQSEQNDRKKQIVVIYTKNIHEQAGITVSGYTKFRGDFSVSRSENGLTENIIVNVGDAPHIDDTLGKLMFFMFDDYNAEKQINIYIPYHFFMQNGDNINLNCTPDKVLVKEDNGEIHDYVESK